MLSLQLSHHRPHLTSWLRTPEEINQSGSLFHRKYIWMAASLLLLPKSLFILFPAVWVTKVNAYPWDFPWPPAPWYAVLHYPHMKSITSLTRTHKMDSYSNARLPWCYLTPLAMSILGMGRILTWGSHMQGLHGKLLQENGWARMVCCLFVFSCQQRTLWSLLFDAWSM